MSCRTNCILNRVNLILSNECCSTYCNTNCTSYTQSGQSDRVKRDVATQSSVTTHSTSSHLISEFRIWFRFLFKIWLSGILALFLILALKFLRKRNSSSYQHLSHEETDFTVTDREVTVSVTDSTETDSTDTDSTTSEVVLLADKYVGKWENSDEEVTENFPNAPLDAILSRQN